MKKNVTFSVKLKVRLTILISGVYQYLYAKRWQPTISCHGWVVEVFDQLDPIHMEDNKVIPR